MVEYPVETLNEDDDDGTMPDNVLDLAKQVVGQKIVKVEKNVRIPGSNDFSWRSKGTAITLDNGKQVFLVDTDDCCAYTELETFLLHVDKIDHVITGIGTTEGYTHWHIYADMSDVLELTLNWSCGNLFYYAYGFDIKVIEPAE